MHRVLHVLPILALAGLSGVAVADDVPPQAVTPQFNVASFKVSGMS